MEQEDLYIIEKFEDFINSQNNTNKYYIDSYKVKENCVGKALLYVHVSGSRGGSCWNSDPSHEYSRDSEDILSDIAGELSSKFNDICKVIGNLQLDITKLSNMYADKLKDTEIAEKFQNEYYGNYTIYNLYAVNMSDFFKDILCTHDFELFTTALENVKAKEDPLFIKNTLTTRQEELSKQLKEFDSLKALEKNRIKKDLDRQQELYDKFDERTIKLRDSFEKELKKVTKDLAQFEPEKITKNIQKKKTI